MQREPIWDRARGRWSGILMAIGVSSKSLRNKHGPCPFPGCGGKDRFRFDDKGGNGTFICSRCGAGNGVEFVKRFLGVDFKAAAEEIEKHISDAVVMPTSKGQRDDDQKKRDDMNALWKRAKQITLDDAAGRYLNRRLGLADFPPVLRQVSDERYTEAGQRASWHPAMIARVDPSDEARDGGERAALHRTFLSADGDKAAVGSPRKMLGSMPTGAAVRLMQHEDVLGIAEGIETAFSASVLFSVPVWAALTADLLQAWEPPVAVKTVMVFGDNDASFTGQAAAYSLARRLKTKGMNVIVELPARMETDWNDVLVERRLAA
jgi:putative DNA primase/helicase